MSAPTNRGKILVEQSYVIDGRPVDKVASFCGLDVYRNSRPEEEKLLLYFVQKGVVVQTQTVEADMGQGVGYISDCTFHSDYERG